MITRANEIANEWAERAQASLIETVEPEELSPDPSYSISDYVVWCAEQGNVRLDYQDDCLSQIVEDRLTPLEVKILYSYGQALTRKEFTEKWGMGNSQFTVPYAAIKGTLGVTDMHDSNTLMALASQLVNPQEIYVSLELNLGSIQTEVAKLAANGWSDKAIVMKIGKKPSIVQPSLDGVVRKMRDSGVIDQYNTRPLMAILHHHDQLYKKA